MQDLQEFMRAMAAQIRTIHRQMYGPEFTPAYSKLLDQLFLGSFSQMMERIQAGDGPAVEFGLAFLEVRPYFFRSQYHRTRLIRMLKHVQLSSMQAERLKRILDLEHDLKMKSKNVKWKKRLQECAHEEKIKKKTH